MSAVASQLSGLHIPRIELEADGTARVVRWGMVEGTVLRPGDRLHPGAGRGRLLLLAPHGRGRPMLGLRSGNRLLALPGRVPASPARWQVLSSVQLVERELERGAPRDGTWTVALRFEALRPDAALDEALRSFQDGVLDARALDALCLRASLAPRRLGVAVAVVATQDPTLAAQVIADTPVGCLRFELGGEQAPAGQVIAGPWAGSADAAQGGAQPRAVASRPSSRQVQLPFVLEQGRRLRHG